MLPGEGHGGAESNGVAGEPGWVDYLCARQLLLQLGNASLIGLLLSVRGVVF